MKIEVTADDILKGERAEPCGCPIALACKRAGLGMHFTVSTDRINSGHFAILGGNYSLPEEARCFVRSFDCGYNVEPFSFEVPGLEAELKSPIQ